MITANYYDGESSRRHPVKLLFHRGILALDGEGMRRSIRLSKVRVSEPMQHAPRLLHLPGGALIESSDPDLPRLLRKHGYREPRIVRWQRNWHLCLLALVSLLALLVAGYKWGLPAAADQLAQHMPESTAKRIGEQQLELLDSTYMRPSRLEEAHRARLVQRFAALKQPGQRTPYRIEFRNSGIGANAFALPNGVIVMTDQLVELAGNDEAVLGVLGHELGHVQGRHSLRGLLQAVGVGAVLHLMVGDVSGMLVAGSTFLLDQKYSRDFEREADGYAISMMRANGVPLTPMADLFERMGEEREPRQPGKRLDEEDESDFLSSHPADAERIARFRAADRR